MIPFASASYSCRHLQFWVQATAQLDQKRRELAVHLQKMGVGLGSLGKRVVTGTTDLFDQVTCNVVTLTTTSPMHYICGLP